MSLAHLKLKGNIIHPINIIAWINFVLMMVVLIMSTTIFAAPSAMEMKFPSPLLEASAQSGRRVEISVTSENVIYTNGKVVTLNDLRKFLAAGDFRGSSILIKADRRASMGRIGDILNLCRGIPEAVVHVSTVS